MVHTIIEESIAECFDFRESLYHDNLTRVISVPN